MKDLITEARELCERATGGPWTGEENTGVQTATGKDVFQTGCGCCTSAHLSADDAAFIARSRTLIPELCDALENANAEIDRLSRLAMMQDGEIGDRDREIEDLKADVEIGKALNTPHITY